MHFRLPIIGFAILFIAAGASPSAAEWTFLPPDPPPGTEATFTFIDGSASDDVWAVGAYQPAAWQCLAEHFDGTSWTLVPLPDNPNNSGRLKGVTAISPNHAIAVGTHTPVGSIAQPLAMEWDGSSWQLLSVPENDGGRVFSAVDHTQTGQTWVAGFESGQAFLARKDGGSWHLEFAPPVGGFRNRFYGMHARTDDEIWVVGTQSGGFGEFRILLQRYDGGSNWTTFSVPSPYGLDEMQDVVAFAPDDAWAVGFYYHVPLYYYQPLIMHYDGTDWTTVDLPLYPEGSVRLEGVAARAPDDIYTAGTYGTSEGIPRPFMLHYDGEGWSEVTLPATGGSNEWFQDVGVTNDGAIWAVGAYYNGTSTEPMAFVNPPAPASVSPIAVELPTLRSAPNPFRSRTLASFSLKRPGHVALRVWDGSGRLVRTLVDRPMQVGDHIVSWNGHDEAGVPVAAGVYYYRLEAEGETIRGSVVRVK